MTATKRSTRVSITRMEDTVNSMGPRGTSARGPRFQSTSTTGSTRHGHAFRFASRYAGFRLSTRRVSAASPRGGGPRTFYGAWTGLACGRPSCATDASMTTGVAPNTSAELDGSAAAGLGAMPIAAALANATATPMCLLCPFISVLASRPGTSAITPSYGGAGRCRPA